MVSTRHHPRPFPEPRTPTPASAVRSTASSNTSRNSASPKPDVARRSQGRTSKSASASPAAFVSSPSPSSHSYSHVANPIITTWLLISLPLVFWDTGYIFLRPHSMPGGRCHWPLWTPYALYGTVDYMYGWPAWNNGVGFTAAQGTLNALEAALYIYYLYVLATQGGNAVLRIWDVNGFWRADVITVQGPAVTTAVLACFASAVMTVSKTVLYWLNEYFSNFENIGHNSWWNLFWLWIVPNGLWLVFPSYMIYALGNEIVSALDGAANTKRD